MQELQGAACCHDARMPPFLTTLPSGSHGNKGILSEEWGGGGFCMLILLELNVQLGCYSAELLQFAGTRGGLEQDDESQWGAGSKIGLSVCVLGQLVLNNKCELHGSYSIMSMQFVKKKPHNFT